MSFLLRTPCRAFSIVVGEGGKKIPHMPAGQDAGLNHVFVEGGMRSRPSLPMAAMRCGKGTRAGQAEKEKEKEKREEKKQENPRGKKL